MRALVVFAHYFRAEPNPTYSSNDARRREVRRRSIERVLLAWRAHFGESAVLNVEHRKFELAAPALDALDLVVLVNRDDHLLDDALLQRCGVQKIVVDLDQPRALPFAAHRVMADRKTLYDWFVYSEEDLLLHDASLFGKLAAFQAQFGPRRVLLPNRYEINAAALRPKTYIDGDLRFALMSRLLAMVEERDDILVHRRDDGVVKYARARNPHSGFFALSAEQLGVWSRQPHFLDMDCSFISPLESAATLGLLKTFSIFKPAQPMHHLEIEHLDNKFSGMPLPVLLRGEIGAG
ncbi:MAG: hypothetical protein JWN07_2213 [Hyphomicrobiales bacterium]|nr:hypothetical protein [Hyphomicrobiales bacterium]